MVVASGARYRRPEIENLDQFEGRGVWYWASPIEARLCAEQEVVLVGGGNSAGQAAVFLSGHARKVLHDHPRRRPRRQHVALSDRAHRGHAEYRIDLQHRGGRAGRRRKTARSSACAGRAGCRAKITIADIRNLFLFVGADPATAWLDGCGVTLDRGGFVVTGAQSEQNQGRLVPQLETSVPGVFAVGDVRSGSVKRVGGAIGEGAQVVAALHGFLGDAAKPAL